MTDDLKTWLTWPAMPLAKEASVSMRILMITWIKHEFTNYLNTGFRLSSCKHFLNISSKLCFCQKGITREVHWCETTGSRYHCVSQFYHRGDPFKPGLSPLLYHETLHQDQNIGAPPPCRKGISPVGYHKPLLQDRNIGPPPPPPTSPYIGIRIIHQVVQHQ